MVPPPSEQHQAIGTALIVALTPLAAARGLVARYATGLFRPGVDDDDKVPDQLYARPELRSQRGMIECLGVRAETVEGKLRLTWESGSADI